MIGDRFHEAESIFQIAADLAPMERAAIVAERCGADAELLVLVERLLQHHDSGMGLFLNAPAPKPATEYDDSASYPERIGSYEILGRIGEGGMATVFQARQSNPNRVVALKVIRRTTVDASLVRRFRFETRVLAQLSHPGIASVYEAGETSGGILYFAMELVDGSPLDRYVEGRNLDLTAKLALMAEICDAVQHAHDRGVIHRDLKPANILVGDGTGGEPLPKVLDFGVARALRTDLQTVSMYTSAGQIVGTIAYMSPEQIAGNPEEIDERSDVYQLGVILYELLTGERPYSVTDLSVPRAARVILESEPRPLRSVDARYRGDIEAIVGTALFKEAKRRYASAGRMAEDIRRYLSNEPIRARPASWSYRFRKLAKRKREVFTGLVLGFAAAVAIIASWMLGPRSDSSHEGPPAATGAPRLRRLTVLPDDVSFFLLPGSISPDGQSLALPFRRTHDDGPALGVISLESGQMRPVPGPAGEVYSVRWMPDGENLLTFEYQGDIPWRARGYGEEEHSQIWLRNISHNENRKIYEHPSYTGTLWPVSSPDGQRIAMFHGDRHSIWVMDASGDNLRQILHAPGDRIGNPAWSPTGTRLAYVRRHEVAGVAFGNLETCDLAGSTTVIIEGELRLDEGRESGTVLWLPDGRLIFARYTSRLRRTNQFWSVQVDPVTGLPRGEPERFLDVSGATLCQPTVSSDGQRLAFYKSQSRASPRLLELNAHGDSVGVRRWTSQERPARAGTWTKDGRRLFFTVEMTDDDCDIYVADVERGLEEPLVRTSEFECFQCLSPDESACFFWQGDLLKRMPLGGGPAVEILRSPMPIFEYWDAAERAMCGTQPDSRCVFKRIEGDETAFYELDPRDGAVGQEILRVGMRLDPPFGRCDLSPDGTRIAAVDVHAARMFIIDLDDGSVHELKKDWRGTPIGVAWSGDGTWLSVTGWMGDVTYWIRRVDLDGSSRFIWRSELSDLTNVTRPSPDGSCVAFTTGDTQMDVWMAEGF